MTYFEQDAYMFSFDLKSGYHHVEIFEGHQTYLGFTWKCPVSLHEKFYVFTVLPFGLSTACYIYSRKHWRYLNIYYIHDKITAI
jgi:hypothetical protein